MKYISVKEFQKGVPKILYMEDAFPLMIQRRGVDIAILMKPDSYGRRKRDNSEPVPSEGKDSVEGVKAEAEEVREEASADAVIG